MVGIQDAWERQTGNDDQGGGWRNTVGPGGTIIPSAGGWTGQDGDNNAGRGGRGGTGGNPPPTTGGTYGDYALDSLHLSANGHLFGEKRVISGDPAGGGNTRYDFQTVDLGDASTPEGLAAISAATTIPADMLTQRLTELKVQNAQTTKQGYGSLIGQNADGSYSYYDKTGTIQNTKDPAALAAVGIQQSQIDNAANEKNKRILDANSNAFEMGAVHTFGPSGQMIPKPGGQGGGGEPPPPGPNTQGGGNFLGPPVHAPAGTGGGGVPAGDPGPQMQGGGGGQPPPPGPDMQGGGGQPPPPGPQGGGAAPGFQGGPAQKPPVPAPLPPQPATPAYAGGMPSGMPGHWGVVGDAGPEVAYLPAGSTVIPNSISTASGLLPRHAAGLNGTGFLGGATQNPGGYGGGGQPPPPGPQGMGGTPGGGGGTPGGSGGGGGQPPPPGPQGGGAHTGGFLGGPVQQGGAGGAQVYGDPGPQGQGHTGGFQGGATQSGWTTPPQSGGTGMSYTSSSEANLGQPLSSYAAPQGGGWGGGGQPPPPGPQGQPAHGFLGGAVQQGGGYGEPGPQGEGLRPPSGGYGGGGQQYGDPGPQGQGYGAPTGVGPGGKTFNGPMGATGMTRQGGPDGNYLGPPTGQGGYQPNYTGQGMTQQEYQQQLDAMRAQFGTNDMGWSLGGAGYTGGQSRQQYMQGTSDLENQYNRAIAGYNASSAGQQVANLGYHNNQTMTSDQNAGQSRNMSGFGFSGIQAPRVAGY